MQMEKRALRRILCHRFPFDSVESSQFISHIGSKSSRTQPTSLVSIDCQLQLHYTAYEAISTHRHDDARTLTCTVQLCYRIDVMGECLCFAVRKCFGTERKSSIQSYGTTTTAHGIRRLIRHKCRLICAQAGAPLSLSRSLQDFFKSKENRLHCCVVLHAHARNCRQQHKRCESSILFEAIAPNAQIERQFSTEKL